jgi:hypothetical protein
VDERSSQLSVYIFEGFVDVDKSGRGISNPKVMEQIVHV